MTGASKPAFLSEEKTSSVAGAGVAINAAVVRAKGGLFSIEALRLKAPRGDEVPVRIVATGMFHTDMVARDEVYD